MEKLFQLLALLIVLTTGCKSQGNDTQVLRDKINEIVSKNEPIGNEY